MGLNKAYLKELARSIKNSKARFLSIMGIIAIGVGFYAGINATEPDMVLSADRYYKDTKLSDFRIISPLGFEKEDLDELEQLKYIDVIQEGYFTDLFVTLGDDSHIGRIYSYHLENGHTNNSLNQLEVIEGRLPEKSGEMVVDAEVNIPIGSEVTVSAPTDKDLYDYLHTDTFTIVGRVQSPLYINFERGQTNIGDGSIDFYAYVLHKDFTMERFAEVYVKTDQSVKYTAYTEAYRDYIEPIQSDLETIGQKKMQEKTEEIRNEILEGKEELEENKKKAQEELAKAKQELIDGEEEITRAEKELEENRKKYRAEIASARNEIEDGKRQLQKGKALYEENYAKWLQGKKEYEQGVRELQQAKAKLDQARKQIDEGEAQLARLKDALATVQEIESFKQSFNMLDEKATSDDYRQLIDRHPLLPEPLVQELEKFAEGFQQFAPVINQILDVTLAETLQTIFAELPIEGEDIATLEQFIAKTEQALSKARQEYEKGYAEYELGAKELEKAKAQIDRGEKELQEARAQLEKSERELVAGEKKLNQEEQKLEAALEEGQKQLVEARKEIEEGWQTYSEEKEKAEEEIKKAEEEIREAERDLLELPEEWIVQSREANPGYSAYGDDAERIGAIAKVFPLFFFLVAALVALTTMTRMVDEERVQIGTLKALGYGTMSIASKYLIYALISSFVGAILGLAIGYTVFPYVIMDAYGMMYNIPVKLTPFHWDYAIISVLLAIVTTTSATLVAILQELKSQPAVLMQPKAPKPGKRILLERIKPLWSRLSFSYKVSFRNVFRYKRRFFMTVFGIGGCTGLLVTGFGIQDSVNDIVDKQFNEIFLYDGQIFIDDEKLSEDKLHELFSENKTITSYLPIQMETIEPLQSGSNRTYEANLMVVLDTETFTDMIDLHERQTGNPVPLPDDGVVITEKLAKLLKVDVGDTFEFRDTDNVAYEVVVRGIAENYLTHYVYFTPEYYESVTKSKPTVNATLFNVKDSESINQEQFKENLMEHEGILNIVFMSRIQDEFQDTMGNLDFVIIVIIVSAGSLAFLVLFNLTNINITERIREIATIKVLGFRNREVDAYIFRENMFLTIIGTFVGLFLGILLHKYIIETMEIDTMMFGQHAHVSSFIWAVLLTLLFAILVNLFMHSKLKKVNMVESLKSVE